MKTRTTWMLVDVGQMHGLIHIIKGTKRVVGSIPYEISKSKEHK